MAAWMHKHRVTHQIGGLLALLLLTAPCKGQVTVVESVPPLESWCAYHFINSCAFPTDLAAAQAEAAGYYAKYGSVGISVAITSCDGKGRCSYIAHWPDGSTTSGSDWTIGGPHLACPEPIVNPTSRYYLNYAARRCERYCLSPFVLDPTTGRCKQPDNLIITLSGSAATEPATILPFIATVIDQNTNQPPTTPVQVKVSLKVDSTSGGHDHGTGDRPRGGIANVQTCLSDATCWTNQTDSNGMVVFNFNATDASGTHTITATCDGCANTATKPVDVKVDNLWPIPDSSYYALTEDGGTKVVGSTTKHKSNHYLTSAASMKVWKLAADYYNYQVLKGVNTPLLLHLNDASLMWGGVFDLHADWGEPHAEHKRGTVVDVRANSSPGAIPAADFSAFKAMAKLLKVDSHLESGSTNQHFHLRLLNRKE